MHMAHSSVTRRQVTVVKTKKFGTTRKVYQTSIGGSVLRLNLCVDHVSPSRAEVIEGLYCLNRTRNSSLMFPYYRRESVFGKLIASRWDFASSRLKPFQQNLFVRLPKI